MIGTPVETLRGRASAVAARIGPPAGVAATEATVGGGSLPGDTLPSAGVALAIDAPDRLAAALRAGRPHVHARVAGGELILDLRTVDPADDGPLATAVAAALAAGGWRR